MAELRYNPMLDDWVMVASHRQGRPQMPENWCPFCPGSGRVPDDYEVLRYDNDFPALSRNPLPPDDVAGGIYRAAPSYGKCEVILYSPGHTTTLPELSEGHMEKLVDLWRRRFEALSEDLSIEYIFIFENRGEAVGVTMPHPHGQIYGYPFIPKKLRVELECAKRHMDTYGACLFCEMLRQELDFGKRVIFQNEHFTVYLPFYSEYPYGVYIVANRHVDNLAHLREEERKSLASIIRQTVGMLDSLFGFPFPYMMCMHNSPPRRPDTAEYFHFHIEFFPPMRSEMNLKFNASSETGAWAHCNPTSPEEKSMELREAHGRYLAARKAKDR